MIKIVTEDGTKIEVDADTAVFSMVHNRNSIDEESEAYDIPQMINDAEKLCF